MANNLFNMEEEEEKEASGLYMAETSIFFLNKLIPLLLHSLKFMWIFNFAFNRNKIKY